MSMYGKILENCTKFYAKINEIQNHKLNRTIFLEIFVGERSECQITIAGS